MAMKILSGTCSEFQGIIIEVEVDIEKAMPSLTIVGLPDAAIKEAKDRVRSAIINSGFKFPLGRITINLAPADVRKNGSLFDLPIAIAILMETGQIIKKDLDRFIIFGELSLTGEIKGVKGAFSIFLEGIQKGINKFIFPEANVNECDYIENTEFYQFSTLNQVVSFINYEDVLPYENSRKIEENTIYGSDFSQIIGQEGSKRAMVISASGRHNLLIFGSTGCGKTMLANALPSIIPDLSFEEKIEVAKIYSVSGLISTNSTIGVPFRAPHHSITPSALVGGGRIVKAGEVTLANNGVLFLDELLEFNSSVLNLLREPLEEGTININRIQGNFRLKADFLFLAGLNTCPCGKLGINNEENSDCICSEAEIRRYQNRLSKALKDRIDLFNYVPRVKYTDIRKKSEESTSKKMKEKVMKAREAQKIRLTGTNYKYNSQIKGKDIFELCRVNKKVEEILKYYFDISKPSLRAYGKVIKVARTIADIEGDYEIKESSVIEAMGYRKDFNGEII